MSNSLLRTYYRLLRRVIRLVAKPDLSGVEHLDPHLEETGSGLQNTNTGEQATPTKREIIYVRQKVYYRSFSARTRPCTIANLTAALTSRPSNNCRLVS